MAPENDIIIQELLATMQELRLAIASGRPHAQPVVRRQSQCIDKALPLEVWERIFSYLYPSQITRLSKVNKTLHDIVAASSLWSKMFSQAFGPDAVLCTLPAMPESKSYMLYMCAVSTRVCEQCLVHAVPSMVRSELPARPLPVLVPDARLRRLNHPGPHQRINKRDSLWPGGKSQGAPRLFGQRIIYGEPINTRWTIRLCLPCRQAHYETYPEPIPKGMEHKRVTANQIINMGFILTDAEIRSLTHDPTTLISWTEYSVEEAFILHRHKVGGNAGMALLTTEKVLWKEKEEQNRTDARIEEYCHF
ncbi:hypothetical protein EMPS_07422 [Entomortierella parvispora]|uniref:F-box domain-containing protein n=1 Tax=Entomortierella parvispora TaxID=205924 RepID=A0A9P3HE63_9FUNG|nr:hypothetical protein EMPS_07422 [Entomortierella parvispora]